jgi:hypothetical protein
VFQGRNFFVTGKNFSLFALLECSVSAPLGENILSLSSPLKSFSSLTMRKNENE